jgi:CheY-like chemotaxis protein
MIRLVGEATGVEWIMGEGNPVEPEDDAMIFPPADALDALHGAALAGNMRMVRAEAEAIAALDPAYRAFADTIQRMARAFQSQALLALMRIIGRSRHERYVGSLCCRYGDVSAQVQTILVVDDNPVNLGVVGEHLEDNNYNVTVAQDGLEGLKRAEFGQPDLILLDVMMPGIDGFETCRRLKANPLTAEIPVIFMTALTDVADKIAAFRRAASIISASRSRPRNCWPGCARTSASGMRKRRWPPRMRSWSRNGCAADRRSQPATHRGQLSPPVRNGPDGLMLVDALTGQVFDANPAALNMLTDDPADVLGKKIWEIAGLAHLGLDAAFLGDALRGEIIKYDDWNLLATMA